MKSKKFLTGTLLLCALFTVSCSDDEPQKSSDIVLSGVTDDSNDPYARNIMTLLSIDPDIAIAAYEGIAMMDEPEAPQGITIYYFGEGTPENVSKSAYKKFYDNGGIFFVSDDNAKKLLELLDKELCFLSTDEPTYIISIDSTAIYVPETPYEGEVPEGEEEEMLDLEPGTYLSGNFVSRIIPEVNEFYYLFSKNFQMRVALPKTGAVPELTITAMKDAIQGVRAQTRTRTSATGGIVLNPQTVFFTWQNQYDKFGTGHQVSQQVCAAYTINAAYNYAEDRDYYQVSGEIITYNNQLSIEKHVKKTGGDEFYVYEGFARGVSAVAMLGYSSLLSSNNPLPDSIPSEFHAYQTSPQTSAGSSSFTTGTSYTIGGNIGVSGQGPSGGINGSMTFSDSRTTSIPDVTVRNYCGTGGSYSIKPKSADQRWVEWQYEIAMPHYSSDFFNTQHCRMKIDDVATIAKTTATYQWSVIWAIDHPKTAFTTPTLSVSNAISVGLFGVRQNVWQTKYGISQSRTILDAETFRLNQPKRD
ncbi:MAG: hypothetical protein LBR34_06580 [Prevotella sp.]|jgi:hypothetical protein|nr:hypothetical protein [Prevotella sp.]